MKERLLWTLFLLAGLVVLPLLALHMIVMHLEATLTLFNTPGLKPIDWANVVGRMKMIGFTLTYPLLLGAALFHGFYGLRTILFELEPRPGLKKALSAVLVIFGLALFVYGTWAAIAAHSLATKGA